MERNVLFPTQNCRKAKVWEGCYVSVAPRLSGLASGPKRSRRYFTSSTISRFPWRVQSKGSLGANAAEKGRQKPRVTAVNSVQGRPCLGLAGLFQRFSLLCASAPCFLQHHPAL